MPASLAPRVDTFIDSNVLLYLLDDDVAKATRAEAVLANGGVVSAHVLGEVTNVLRGRRWNRPWSDVHTVLRAIRANTIVLPVSDVTHARGVEYAERFQLQFFDALHLASAVLANCTTLWTEDMHNGLIVDGCTIRNPFKA
ncbi:MAG: PIN domain-containing protein [Hyphomicrobiaceae bacterium]